MDLLRASIGSCWSFISGWRRRRSESGAGRVTFVIDKELDLECLRIPHFSIALVLCV